MKITDIITENQQGVQEGTDDFSRNVEAFRVYQHLDPMEFYNFANTPQGLKTLAQKAGTTPESVKDSLERMDWGQFPDDFYQDPEDDEQGVRESQAQPLTVAQLATISDEALDRAYGYGRSQPGNTFGWQANLKSAAYAKKMIDSGITDIEAISDAIHKGWNVTAQAFVQNPDQFADTEKLRAAGKLQAKLDQRAKLMRQDYAQLADEEKEKDRVVARALLQALRGDQT
jgi:hypothetical protein